MWMSSHIVVYPSHVGVSYSGGGKTIEMWWWWRKNNRNVAAVVVEVKVEGKL